MLIYEFQGVVCVDHKPQKRFGTPAGFNRAWVQSAGAREVRYPPEGSPARAAIDPTI
jgi:hypothetical protein